MCICILSLPEVDSTSEHAIALALEHRERLARQHGLIQTVITHAHGCYNKAWKGCVYIAAITVFMFFIEMLCIPKNNVHVDRSSDLVNVNVHVHMLRSVPT